jgi:hypothetical protein
MSAIMAVWLGNSYGYSFSAIADAESLLARLSKNQWDYYLNECLPGDELVLQKLVWYDKPRERWVTLVEQFVLGDRTPKSNDVKRLLIASAAKDNSKVMAASERLLTASRK